MPLFFRPLLSKSSVSPHYNNIHHPTNYNNILSGLERARDYENPKTRRNRQRFRRLFNLQGDYIRYAKQMAKYSRTHNLLFRPALNCQIDHHCSTASSILNTPTTAHEIQSMCKKVQSQMSQVEKQMASFKNCTNSNGKTAFAIFRQVAMEGQLEKTVKEFIRVNKKSGWIKEDLERLYVSLRKWVLLHQHHSELCQIELCFNESESLQQGQAKNNSTFNVECAAQVGYTKEALEQLFARAR